MICNRKNYKFFIVTEFVQRKTGFVTLVLVTRAAADRLKDEYFALFDPYSLGSPLSFPDDLIAPFAHYHYKYHDYLEFYNEHSEILRELTATSNGDLTVSVVERLKDISIPEFIAWRNLPFCYGYSLH